MPYSNSSLLPIQAKPVQAKPHQCPISCSSLSSSSPSFPIPLSPARQYHPPTNPPESTSAGLSPWPLLIWETNCPANTCSSILPTVKTAPIVSCDAENKITVFISKNHLGVGSAIVRSNVVTLWVFDVSKRSWMLFQTLVQLKTKKVRSFCYCLLFVLFFLIARFLVSCFNFRFIG